MQGCQCIETNICVKQNLNLVEIDFFFVEIRYDDNIDGLRNEA